MKIDLSAIDKEQFMIHPHQIAGELVWLCQPQHIGAKWSKHNLHLRSSVWNDQGELISAGFPKFFNCGEKPDLYPDPEKYKDWNVLEKMDGSLLIVSKYKGQMIFRTRGTVDATKIDNGYEIAQLMEKYPKIIQKFDKYDTAPYSILFEWVTPTNQIVIKVEEPDLILLNVIWHEDYKLWQQVMVDALSVELEINRPKRFSFNTLAEALAVVKEFKNMEGVCLYYNGDQNIVKLKGDWYLYLHAMKSEMSNIEKVLDVYLSQGQPSYNDFYTFINDTMDFEIAERAKSMISQLCDIKKEVEAIVNHMNKFVKPLKNVSRKEAAIDIMAAYGNTNRSSFCFSLLDGKMLTLDQIKKLYFQIMKKG